MGADANDVQAMIILGIPSSAIATGEQSAVTLSEPSGGLEFFKLVGDDVIYSNAHIAKVWTLEPTALSDARQALVSIRAGKELKDRFEGKTAADVEEQVRQLEAEFRSGSESDGQAQPEAEPEPAALEASREQQALALLGTHDAKAAEFLRAQLAEARGQPREGVPPEP